MGPREILIIAVIVLLLFGAPKLPELARSVGKSLKILKDETKELTSDSSKDGEDKASDAPASGSTVVESESTIEDPAKNKSDS